jgi:hypothetical protein
MGLLHIRCIRIEGGSAYEESINAARNQPQYVW